MKVSVCITTFNEENSVKKLLDSIKLQTKKPDEIVIVDGGSKDKTIEKIREYKNTKLVISKGASIAKGRNIATKNSSNEIIVMTDAGCIAYKNWIKEITKPFERKETDVVAGFYEMIGKTNFQKALKPFLGIMPENFKDDFLPSTRSIAFRKNVWKKVHGFSEKFDRAGEDTDFDSKIIQNNFLIVRNKKAIVKWEVPDNLKDACLKFFYYARGDAQSAQFYSTHNVKVYTIFARYLIFLIIPDLFILYLLFPIFKFRKYKFDSHIRLWTVIIQIASDLSVMLGFLAGTWVTLNK